MEIRHGNEGPRNDKRRGWTSARFLLATAILTLAIGAANVAQENPPGAHIWKLSEIESRGKALAQKLDDHKLANETVLSDGSTSFMVVHREGDGQAEWHGTQADVIVISEGEATETLGGTIVDGKETQPGEIRGTTITGGKATKVSAGDILYIPPKTPHRMTLEPGKTVTYFTTKVAK